MTSNKRNKKKKVCRVCGEKLTRENRYRTKYGKNLGLICKECRNKQKRRGYKTIPKKYTITIDRGSYHPFKLEFDSINERHDFRTWRQLQIRWGQSHTDPSGFAGKAVDRFIQYMDRDTRTYRQYYITETCNCGGIIRYDSSGYKICDNCGLFNSTSNIIEHTYFELDSINEPTRRAMINDKEDRLPLFSYGSYDNTDGLDDGHSTYDVYYARCYKGGTSKKPARPQLDNSGPVI